MLRGVVATEELGGGRGSGDSRRAESMTPTLDLQWRWQAVTIRSLAQFPLTCTTAGSTPATVTAKLTGPLPAWDPHSPGWGGEAGRAMGGTLLLGSWISKEPWYLGGGATGFFAESLVCILAHVYVCWLLGKRSRRCEELELERGHLVGFVAGRRRKAPRPCRLGRCWVCWV